MSVQPTTTNANANTNMSNKISLAAGCYWGTEKFIVRDFQKRHPNSIQSAQVGFMNPTPMKRKSPPTYREVCSGTSGYVEVLDVTLADPSLMEELIRFFFLFHDPTTRNRQGNDVGTQYASAIFCSDNQQKSIALSVISELQQAVTSGIVTSYHRDTIETGILMYTEFHPAHEAHQQYLAKNPSGYCNHFFRFRQWPNAVAPIESDTSSDQDDILLEKEPLEQHKKKKWSFKKLVISPIKKVFKN
ncbi:Peptide methionine sulfoxide reductase MsrA [Seminavis robusta]|uniref:peptide-methionine (S)-S-oxide reductase n=1 Tax=Seminavis robusta TaxID=568900 RepID=A0A9N8F173_9STRA|nr:Peptide methionine sulfoxide reductase MsrA [Seminavis robusta]|eukprot:Sro2311_g322830.1 Peptide methionine sulfoxide reductase MsrA (245) ;mRNA; r:4576-5310